MILFASSCHWSDHCFFDFSSNWFEPRGPASTLSSDLVNSSAMSNQTLDQVGIYAGALNNTAFALAGTALEEAKRQLATKTEWTGIGVEWLRSLLGRREWRLPCVDVYVRLWEPGWTWYKGSNGLTDIWHWSGWRYTINGSIQSGMGTVKLAHRASVFHFDLG